MISERKTYEEIMREEYSATEVRRGKKWWQI